MPVRILAAAASLMLASLPLAASGQALCLEYDVNVPAYAGAQDTDHEQYSTSRGVALGVGWLSRRFEAGVGGHRWRVRVGYQAHGTEWRTSNPYNGKVSATTIEIGHDWYVLHIGSATWSMGAAIGPVFVSSKSESYSNPCDTPFCNLPDGGWVASGIGCLELPLSPNVALSFGIRSRISGPDRTEIFPFAPGLVFSLGVELSGSR
ncbi:MAG: hypothetical protein IPK64_17915 [bacterium]|nr:hypothetical protein [bacterium]